MRLDDLPTSDRIEDRRGLPGGRAGLGVGTVVILGLLAWAFVEGRSAAPACR
jgi:hypothetical protein